MKTKYYDGQEQTTAELHDNNRDRYIKNVPVLNIFGRA